MAKLWKVTGGKDKRSGVEEPTAGESASRRAEAFTVGNDHILDRELLLFDIRASKVHAEALRDAGVLTEEESKKLLGELDRIAAVHAKGEFVIRQEDEDGHTAIELWLTEKLGDLGKKIHTGRSRNDQVLTSIRLYEKERLKETLENLRSCAGLLIRLGEDNADKPMPGYTHTRKAMLSSVGQWVGGFAELLILQYESSSGIYSLIDRSPLGTAAGFGSSLNLDREAEARALGFKTPIVCATTAQLGRGWVELQLVNWLSGITLVLSRMADDIIRFSGDEYGFIELSEEVCTGSSIMPQKKNPDVAELIRGKHALMEGFAATLQGVVRNLGSGYHRDLQLTKEPVIKAFDLVNELLDASELVLSNLSFNRDKMIEACSSDLQAAEAAYKLVIEKGWSFRDAYTHIKSSGEELETGDIDERLREYRQLGSPGNPGLDRLRKRLERD